MGFISKLEFWDSTAMTDLFRNRPYMYSCVSLVWYVFNLLHVVIGQYSVIYVDIFDLSREYPWKFSWLWMAQSLLSIYAEKFDTQYTE